MTLWRTPYFYIKREKVDVLLNEKKFNPYFIQQAEK